MTPLTILVIAGSERLGSFNRRLATVASTQIRAGGHTAVELSLRDLDLPIYDGDLEAHSGVPAGAYRLQQALLDCDAMLLVTPEYNGFPTPLEINAFDWLSRISADTDRPAGLATTSNKPAALLSASPGPGGALRSMNFMRQYLQMAFAMIVVPQQFALGKAHEAFDEAGQLKDANAAKAVGRTIESLARLAGALKT